MEGLEKLKEKPPIIGGTGWMEAQRDADVIWFQDWLEKEIGELKVIDQDKIIEAVCGVYPPPDKDENWQIYVDATREAIAQAQLADVKKHFEEMK